MWNGFRVLRNRFIGLCVLQVVRTTLIAIRGGSFLEARSEVLCYVSNDDFYQNHHYFFNQRKYKAHAFTSFHGST